MRTFRIFDDIWRGITSRFSDFIAEIEDGERIRLEVMSYGGDIFSGLAIAEKIMEARNRSIHSTVEIYGIAASAAAIIAIAADHVVMTEIGSMMLHGVYREEWDGEGFVSVDKGDDIDRANAVCLAIIRRRCPGYSLDMLTAKDNWYSAHEAKGLGLVDEIRPLEDFAKDADFKNMFAGFLNMAAHAKPNGGKKMSKTSKVKNELDEKDVETQIEEQEEKVDELEIEEQEEKVDELENEEGSNDAEEADLKTLIVDGMTAILNRLDAIEKLLTPDETSVDAEGECGGDEKKDDIMSAKIRVMYDKIGKVCKPCTKKTLEEKDSAQEVKATAERVKKVFPNISKYYE